jgi:hypothetical protein
MIQSIAGLTKVRGRLSQGGIQAGISNKNDHHSHHPENMCEESGITSSYRRKVSESVFIHKIWENVDEVI